MCIHFFCMCVCVRVSVCRFIYVYTIQQLHETKLYFFPLNQKAYLISSIIPAYLNVHKSPLFPHLPSVPLSLLSPSLLLSYISILLFLFLEHITSILHKTLSPLFLLSLPSLLPLFHLYSSIRLPSPFCLSSSITPLFILLPKLSLLSPTPLVPLILDWLRSSFVRV